MKWVGPDCSAVVDFWGGDLHFGSIKSCARRILQTKWWPLYTFTGIKPLEIVIDFVEHTLKYSYSTKMLNLIDQKLTRGMLEFFLEGKMGTTILTHCQLLLFVTTTKFAANIHNYRIASMHYISHTRIICSIPY